ncbi:hypothetical protein SKAU_G00380850 [Synaphobranchus kaupii]|uniref:BMP and activin membrane-bound inhibitor N-terminal domain-containing protein n=1 Tax=Synaphobranchus kaupii TaxID=118154 RepID=A0A9Q1EDM5_SYNKA|nr:hypothetical protein SKAU_G00380850 [Synaphobranchus kaupii]
MCASETSDDKSGGSSALECCHDDMCNYKGLYDLIHARGDASDQGSRVPARRRPGPGDEGPGAGLHQGGVVPGGGDRRAHRRRADPGAADHAGPAHAAEREQATAGPAAADALAAALQLPRAPRQEGPPGQAGPGVHGARHGPRELLPDLRQNAAGRPVAGALGDVQRTREAGVRMICPPPPSFRTEPGVLSTRRHFRLVTFQSDDFFFSVVVVVVVFLRKQKKKKNCTAIRTIFAKQHFT